MLFQSQWTIIHNKLKQNSEKFKKQILSRLLRERNLNLRKYQRKLFEEHFLI